MTTGVYANGGTLSANLSAATGLTAVNFAANTGSGATSITAPALSFTFQEPTIGTGIVSISGGNAANTITVGSTPATADHTFDASAALSKISYKSGAGVQTIKTGAGADTITAGTGADVIQVSATGDTIKIAALTESASGATGIALVSGTTVVNNLGTNVGLDVVTFASTPATGNTLVFDFSALNSGTYTAGAITPATIGSGLAGTAAAAVGVLLGTTHGTSGVFTAGGTATTSMIQVDTDSAAAGVVSITVVGVVASAALSSGGLLTLTF